ncbi:MAG: hypothetical protein H7A01_15850 [Hahellaceae bacterium]|nr:hypothetical protein [Hahellaceae bacterium]MCP5210528.1 hypothetical protein [Hahellaceae bacterium]
MDRGVRLPVNLIIRRFVLKASLLFFVSMGSTFAADEFRVDRQRVADPTKPSGFSRVAAPQTVQKAANNYTLSSIVYGGGRSQAVINGRFYQQGDSVDGAKIMDIRRDSVILQDETGSRVLRWKPSASLKRK